MEEGGAALSFPRLSFFRGRGNLAAHDFLEVGWVFAGEFDLLGNLSRGHIIMIRRQCGLFFLQAVDVGFAERLELLDHHKIQIGLFLKVLSMIFFRVADVYQCRAEYLRDSAAVIFAACNELFELWFQHCLCLAVWKIP